VRYWLPEIINRLRLPEWVLPRARRSEIAAAIVDARRRGLGWVFRLNTDTAQKIRARAPRRPNTKT
jgi:hypothetical protein